jgi:hypothetical protein
LGGQLAPLTLFPLAMAATTLERPPLLPLPVENGLKEMSFLGEHAAGHGGILCTTVPVCRSCFRQVERLDAVLGAGFAHGFGMTFKFGVVM